MHTHPARNNHRANLYCGVTALMVAVLSLGLFYMTKSFYLQSKDFAGILSHPLVLAIAGISSKWGADIGLYLFKQKYKYVSIQHKTDCRLIAFWIFSVFMLLSLLNLFANGLQINPG